MATRSKPREGLTPVQLVQAVAIVAEQWLKSEGLEAFAAYSEVLHKAAELNISIPDWATWIPASNAETTEACRVALDQLLSTSDSKVRTWAQEAVKEMQTAHPQVLDPVTLSVGGVVLVGLILAGRVKKVGPKGVEFYKGLPAGLSTLFKQLFEG
jgi:hypothetical protein